jgi:hypothetical protein
MLHLVGHILEYGKFNLEQAIALLFFLASSLEVGG